MVLPIWEEGKWGGHSCSLAESCLWKPKAELSLWARSLSQTIVLPTKHHLASTPSPASSRLYEGVSANSFQSFPSQIVFLWAGKFPSRWLDTSSPPGCGCYDSCSQFSNSSSCQSFANTTLACLVFSGKSKYASVFSLLISSCLCLLLFGISGVKTALCCQYFNNRFSEKKLSPPQSKTDFQCCIAWAAEKRDWGIYFYGLPLKQKCFHIKIRKSTLLGK